ncbi:hypothetical protein KRR40_10155 [Niabella defluvii]|nr:hypothetical protein KRR40_10155 [Niabella sp. I65]
MQTEERILGILYTVELVIREDAVLGRAVCQPEGIRLAITGPAGRQKR